METPGDDTQTEPQSAAPHSRKLKLALRARAAARAAVMGSRRGWGWLREQWRQGRSPAMWLLGLMTGIASGYAALAFILAIHGVSLIVFGANHDALASGVDALPGWRVFVGPVIGGLIVAGLLFIGQRYNWLTETRAHAVADVVEARAVRSGRVTLKTGLLSALISAISLGSGGSAGREGPAVHLGGALASFGARSLGVPARAVRTLLACGAAAAVAASFNAPIAGALFAFEVVLGHYALRSIAPVAIASVAGAVVSRIHLGATPAFTVPAMGAASPWDLPGVFLLSLAAAGLAIAFVQSSVHAPRLVAQQAEKWRIPLWALPSIGGIGIGLLALPMPEILGVGYEATSNALGGQYAVLFLLGLIVMKLIATGMTLGFRFGGGVFSPALYLGAMLGAAFGSVIGLATGGETGGVPFYAVVGMGAVAGAALGAPLSTTLIVFELTANYEASVAVLVAVSIATVLTQAMTGGSIFQKQILRHGYDLSRGQSRVLLQTIRVRDIMAPYEGDEADMDTASGAPTLYDDDYLGRAIGLLSAESLDGAPVRSRSDDQPVVGWLSRADAHAAYARALEATHEEEHL